VGNCYLLSTVDFMHFIHKTRGRREVKMNPISTFLGRPPRRGRSRRPHMDFEKYERHPKGWLIPKLADARARWDKRMFEVDWDDNTEWEKMTKSEWNMMMPSESDPF